MEVDNPFEEVIAPARLLHREDPVSKHRRGRTPKMSDAAKRRRARVQRKRISDYLDAKVLENAVNG